MKFGIVVSVCTAFLKGLHFTSFKNTANSTGRKEVAIPSKLMANVFFNTINSCDTCVGLLNRDLNHFSPTNSHWDNFKGAL